MMNPLAETENVSSDMRSAGHGTGDNRQHLLESPAADPYLGHQSQNVLKSWEKKLSCTNLLKMNFEIKCVYQQNNQETCLNEKLNHKRWQQGVKRMDKIVNVAVDLKSYLLMTGIAQRQIMWDKDGNGCQGVTDYMDRLLDETESTASSCAPSPPPTTSTSSSSQTEREDNATIGSNTNGMNANGSTETSDQWHDYGEIKELNYNGPLNNSTDLGPAKMSTNGCEKDGFYDLNLVNAQNENEESESNCERPSKSLKTEGDSGIENSVGISEASLHVKTEASESLLILTDSRHQMPAELDAQQI